MQIIDRVLMRLAYAAALIFFGTDGPALSQEAAKKPAAQAAVETTPTKEREAALPIPPELAAPGKWEAFKQFWQKLDAIDTQAEMELDRKAKKTREDFSKRIGDKYAKLDELNGELARLLPQSKFKIFFGRVMAMDGKNADELSSMAQLLYGLAAQRIFCIYLKPRMMMSRMPTYLEMYEREIMRRVEQQIDLLVAAQAKKNASDAELGAILALIDKDLWLAAKLSVFHGAQNACFGLIPVAENSNDAQSKIVVPVYHWDESHKFNEKVTGDFTAWERGFDLACKRQTMWLIKELAKAKTAKRVDEKRVADLKKQIIKLDASAAKVKRRIAELEKLRDALGILLRELERR